MRGRSTLRCFLLIPVLLAGAALSASPAVWSAQIPAPQSQPGQMPIAPSEPSQPRLTQEQTAPQQNLFHVKYVSEGAIYLDAGHNASLEEGMVLHLVHADPNGGTTESVRFTGQEPIADVRIFSVADSSSAAEIVKSREDIVVGDIAYLDVESVHTLETTANAKESENYPIVVTFSYGDPLDEELRATRVEAKAPPIENMMRGRIGWDMGYLSEPGGISSRQIGLLIDADMNRIGGTHWNFSGFWRGDLNTQNTGPVTGIPPTTFNNLINRTYHLGLFYENPDSLVTMGVGRLYLPYAPSLSTIDGGYFGYRLSQKLTTGVFGGSTPDPTSWSYAPNQHIAGTFLNYQGGNFDHLRYSDTVGLAMTSIVWHVAREFAFMENTISFSRAFSFYNSVQADNARNAPGGMSYRTGLTQSFSSIRYSPVSFLSFDLNHNYLRNLPTFDPALISTGLLDQYLFQGLSGGVRVALPYRIAVTTDMGRSKSSTDSSSSLNQMYDLLIGDIKNTGLQLDMRYTKFNSSFGQGEYEFASLSRNLADKLRIQFQGGVQHLNSTFSANSNSKFVSSVVDWSLGPRFFTEGLFSWNAGTTMNYSQTNFTFGYRFGGSLRK